LKNVVSVCVLEWNCVVMLTEPKDKLREKWVSVRGVPTYTLCQGSKKEDNAVLIIIPGLHCTCYFFCS